MKHRANNTDADYQATVDSLREMLGEGAVVEKYIGYVIPGLEKAIVQAAGNQSQNTDGSLIPAEGSLIPATITWPQRCLVALRRIGQPVPAMAMSVLMAGFIALGLQLQPNPTTVAPSSDADLTFQELWLAEDELLFSDGPPSV